MSADLVARIVRTPAFTPTMTLAKIDAIALIKSDVELRLAKYMSRVEMDPTSAAKAMREMQAWSNDHGPAVANLPPNSLMPEGMRPELPQDQARNWVSSVFFGAVYGFNFFQDGTVRRKIAEGSMTEAQAQDDLEYRRTSFQLLTAMDESGDLARIFGKAGVGLEPVTIGAIAVVAVAVIAIVGVLVYQHYEHAHIRSENMAQFKAWCEEAKKKAEGGDSSAQEAFKECVKNVKPPEPARDPIETALYVLGGVLGLYVIGYYVVPKLIAYRGAR